MEESEEQKKMARKREYILKEIVSTEVTYVERLRFVVEVIIQPLKENNMLDASDLLAQFSILEKIYQLHMKNSLSELETCPNKFGEFFQNICDNVQTYTDYLINYESSMQRRCSLLISNRRFSDFLDKAEKDPRMQGQKSESIFILPVQRIPRYRLLLESLLKCTPEEHPQYGVVTNALEKISDMAMYSNDAIKARENKAKIMDIIKTIEPRTRVDLLADPDRVFLKEGPLLRQCRRGLKEFHFWLFNDQLLYGQATPLGLYILNRQIFLNKCVVNSCESMNDGGYCFIVESPAKSFILCLPTEAEKTEWLDAINNAILTLAKARQSKQSRQSTLAPLWTPDKNSTSCQKCRNPFSLISRRHHCRNCGAIVCDNCSKKRIKLEHVDQHRQVRVCDACFLYLSSPEASRSIRLASARLKRLSATGTSTGAAEGEEGEELYFSDPEEDFEERERLGEEDFEEFNETMGNEQTVEEFHNMVVSGGAGTSTYQDRDSEVELPPSLLQQVGKGFSGVLNFRMRANTEILQSSSSGPGTPNTPNSSSSSSSSIVGSPKPPPKPARRPTAPNMPSLQQQQLQQSSPQQQSSPSAAPPLRGILRSVSAMVASGSTFLSNAAVGNSQSAVADTSRSPSSAPGPASAHPVILHSVSEKAVPSAAPVEVAAAPRPVSFSNPITSRNAASEAPLLSEEQRSRLSDTSLRTSLHEDKSPSPTVATRASVGGDESKPSDVTGVGAGAGAGVDASTSGGSAENNREPPVKPPKPPRMARRTNICINPDDLSAASALVDAGES